MDKEKRDEIRKRVSTPKKNTGSKPKKSAAPTQKKSSSTSHPKKATTNKPTHQKSSSNKNSQQRRRRAYSAGRNMPRHAGPTERNLRKMADPQKMKADDKIKIAVIGGCEEVGRNCTMIEYDGDIIVIDLGIQFPEENMPGIDYIIPNMEYLKSRKKDIKGILITHAHLDHIGAIPHVMEDLGNPTIYTGELTKGMINKRQEDFPNVPKLKFVTVKKDSKVKLGKFNVEFFHVNHNIVNCFGIFVKTPDGNIVHTGDFKFDDTPLNDEPTDYARLKEMGKQGVDILLADSTNAAQPGRQISEYTVTTELDKIFDGTQNHGRLIVGTFASNLNRIQQCIELAEKYGRYVILEGRSINNNVEIANELGYLKFNHKNVITSDEYVKNRKKYPDNKVCVIATGAQGERFAFMMRYVNGEHRFLEAERGDTCIFSSSVIPGNERTVSGLKDALARKGCNVFHYQMLDVHAGGHARQEDLLELINLLQPTYYVPIEQSHHVLKVNADMAIDHGFDPEKAFLVDNGQIMAFKKIGKEIKGKLTDTYIPADYVFVDGLGVGDVSEVVLRDRLILSNDGMVVVIVTLNHKTGRLIGNPDIISRGFIYMKDNKKLVEETRNMVKKIANNTDIKTPAFDDHVKNKVRDEVGEHLFKKTKRRPMVLPVVIKV